MSWRNRFMAVSRLDRYKQYLTGYTYKAYGDTPAPEYTDELFVRELLKLEPQKAKMLGGIAAHSMLEHCQYGDLGNCRVDEWDIIIDCDAIVEVPQMREVSVEKWFNGIPMFGRVDAMDANRVRDDKFTKQINIDNYIDSMQWKAYLSAVNYDIFVYDLFQVKVKIHTDNISVETYDDENDLFIQTSVLNRILSKSITITDYQRLELYRYPTMDDDVHQCMQGYWDLLESLKPLIFDIAKQNNIEIKERK